MDQIRATKRVLVKNYNKTGDQRNLNHNEFLVRGDPVFAFIKKIISSKTNNGTDQLRTIKKYRLTPVCWARVPVSDGKVVL